MSETTQREVKNQKVSATITEEAGCIVSMDVTLAAEEVKACYAKAVKEISKEVSIPGFRKGKAPKQLLIKNYGTHIEREWKQKVSEALVTSSLEAAEVYPLSDESLQSMKLQSCSLEEGASAQLRVECRPNVPEIDLSQLTLAQPEKKQVTEEVMEEALSDLKDIYTDYEKVDRPAQDADSLIVTIDQVSEPQRQLCKDARFELKEGRLSQWMIDVLMGKSAGDVVETPSSWDETTGVKEEEFKSSDLKIEVVSVEASNAPADEAALAERLGLENPDQLREKIKADLESRFENELQEEVRQNLQDQLLEKYPFDIPHSLVESERQVRIRNKIKGLKKQHASRDVILSLEKQIEELVAKEVDRFLHTFFICRQVAMQNEIEVTRDDLVRLFNHQMMMIPPEDRIIEEGMKPEELHDRLLAQVITQKAMNHIVSTVQGGEKTLEETE